MNYALTGVLAALLAMPATLHAQEAEQLPPVEQTEGPEDEIISSENNDEDAGELPQSGQPAAPAPVQGEVQAVSGDPDKAAKWDVNNPPGFQISQAAIDVDEGSWMDVDVSPDGRTIAFALLGDIYTMPIAGGTPTRIAEGLAWEVQPRFSPDGSRIAFTSDRGGGDNIWIMNANGADKRQVTKEDFRLLNQPSWSPDGRYIAAKKHFTTGRSLGTGEIWLYHVSGGGGVQLVERPSEEHQKELGEPIYAPDGNAIYYTKNVTPGPIFEYAQDSNTDLFDILRYDLESGETTTAIGGLGGAVRPQPSPDGEKIAFVRREDGVSKLWVKDLTSGAVRELYGELDRDVQETWAVTGVYPNMSWTPDSSSIVFWASGKLRRIDADGGEAGVIPFRVTDSRGFASAPHPVIQVGEDSFTARMPRFAEVSPDGRRVVFESLGKLYVKDMGAGQPSRLTSGNDDARELFPSWSRDGSRIVYVSWTDADLGVIRTVSPSGGGGQSVTSQPGHFARPHFSPDGDMIVFEKHEGGYLTAPEWSENPGVYTVAASGGTPKLINRDSARGQFGASDTRIFMIDRAEDMTELFSTDLNGQDKRVHASGELINDFAIAPNGEWLAFRQNYEAFVSPILPGGQNVSLAPDAKALPVVKLSEGGADYIHFEGDSARVHWSMGPTVYSVDMANLFPAAPPAEGQEPVQFVAPTSGVSLARTVSADKHEGRVALTGARIVTMAGDDGGIIENATILIDGDRITAVGPSGSVQVPSGTRSIDVTGKTIIPGLVDAHAHGPQGTDELVPQQNWSAIQNLALGTTTIHDPSSTASEIFVAKEMQQAGMLLAPRIFSTGEVVYGAKAYGVYAEIGDYEDALAHVRRLKAQGGHSVKNYNQPRREQRQMVVAASRAENMLVVAEGGSLFGMDMNLAADGNSTLEHNIPLETFYEDVLQFFPQSDTNYTPTLVVTYGGLAGDPYWRQAMNIYEHPLLMAHTPPAELAAAGKRVVTAPEEAFVDDDSAREAKKLADRGVKVSIGAHGQQAGIGSHWELWSFVRGGMSPLEALGAGTIVAAQSLGMAEDIGSLEVGKLADLVVLDADPTQDIRNSDDISYVMLGGRMYDAATMNEVETGDARRLPYWWE